MYTKCPGCNAEISFEPPANKNELPADYKHRIKCPACGVTIGVKINQSPRPLDSSTPDVSNVPAAQPVAAPAHKQQQITNVYHAPMAHEQTAKDKTAAKRHTHKKSGVGRNIMMMLFSLVFIALSVVGYLIGQEKINLPETFDWVSPATYFNGISGWEMLIKEFDSFKLILTSKEVQLIVIYLVPMILFTLSGINFIVALISAIGKKYGRAFNVIFSLLIGASAATILFLEYLAYQYMGISIKFIDYFKLILKSDAYLLIAGAAWGLLQFIFSLFFIKSLKKKKKR